jgi:hypothetical protein
MSNGCICCSLREDLLVGVARPARERRFDYLLIESTGVSEPLSVAETFTFAGEDGRSLSDFARLDTMVTVVDGAAFLDDLGTVEAIADRGESLGPGDERTVEAKPGKHGRCTRRVVGARSAKPSSPPTPFFGGSTATTSAT